MAEFGSTGGGAHRSDLTELSVDLQPDEQLHNTDVNPISLCRMETHTNVLMISLANCPQRQCLRLQLNSRLFQQFTGRLGRKIRQVQCPTGRWRRYRAAGQLPEPRLWRCGDFLASQTQTADRPQRRPLVGPLGRHRPEAEAGAAGPPTLRLNPHRRALSSLTAPTIARTPTAWMR
jgi:hypothetical protein